MTSLISEIPAVEPSKALEHFSRRLAFETDCSDVYQSQVSNNIDYVLVDVRGDEAFLKKHIPNAINIPTRTITKESMAKYPLDTLFVVYCAGPHCNGVHKAAIRLAKLGYSVKEMLGGLTGWIDEGLVLEGNAFHDSKEGFSCEC